MLIFEKVWFVYGKNKPVLSLWLHLIFSFFAAN